MCMGLQKGLRLTRGESEAPEYSEGDAGQP
jgi:hypothetical protein